MRRGRVHVMGASGAGTTTLGRALAECWAVPHADADDYFWVPTNPPYVDRRPAHERAALMRALFVPREAWVLSGSVAGWGDDIVAECDAVVFVTLDPKERIRRLQVREHVRQAAGPVDEAARRAFLDWARGYDDPAFTGRSRSGHEQWLAGLSLPVLRLDAGSPPAQLCRAILDWDPERHQLTQRDTHTEA